MTGPWSIALLSERERELVDCRANGLLYKEIAAELDISIHTVKAHFSRIFNKTKATTGIELIAFRPPGIGPPHRRKSL